MTCEHQANGAEDCDQDAVYEIYKTDGIDSAYTFCCEDHKDEMLKDAEDNRDFGWSVTLREVDF